MPAVYFSFIGFGDNRVRRVRVFETKRDRSSSSHAPRWLSMFERSYLKATGQLWKFYLFLAAPILGVVLIISSLEIMPKQENLALVLLLSGILFGFIGFSWACLTIMCPRCQTRLLWMALKKQSHQNWMSWLLS